MNKAKIFLIRLFTFCAGLYFVLKFVLPKENGIFNFSDYHEYVVNGFMTVGAMAIGLGLINLFMSHGSTLIYKKKGWIFSGVLLSGLFVMLTVQGMFWVSSLKDSAKAALFVNLSDFSKVILEDQASGKEGVKGRQERDQLLIQAYRNEFSNLSEELKKNNEITSSNLSIEEIIQDGSLDDQEHAVFQQKVFGLSNQVRAQLDGIRQQSFISGFNKILNDGLFVALGSAMFALLGFYIAAAAYRAFRIKSVEAALMMAAALIVMLGQIPFGLWISEDLPLIRLWLLQYPSAGAARAIEIGAGIAGLILAVRMWLSLETESFKGR